MSVTAWPDPPAQVRPAAPAPSPDSADEHPYVAVLVDEALIQLPCSIFGPVFQPRRAGDRQPFVASCSCGAHIRSERHGVVASWVRAHEKGDAAWERARTAQQAARLHQTETREVVAPTSRVASPARPARPASVAVRAGLDRRDSPPCCICGRPCTGRWCSERCRRADEGPIDDGPEAA